MRPTTNRKLYITIAITLATTSILGTDPPIIPPLKTEQMESFSKHISQNSTSGQISYPYTCLSTESIRAYGHHEQAYEIKDTDDYFSSRMHSLKNNLYFALTKASISIRILPRADSKTQMNITKAEIRIANVITDGYIEQFNISNTQVVWIATRNMNKIKETRLFLLNIDFAVKKRPELFNYGIHDYNKFGSTVLKYDKVLSFGLSSVHGNGYFLVVGDDLRWNLIKTTEFGFSIVKQFLLDIENFEEIMNYDFLASFHDMLFVLADDKILVYILDFIVVDDFEEVVVEFDRVFVKVQEISISIATNVSKNKKKLKLFDHGEDVVLVAQFDQSVEIFYSVRKYFSSFLDENEVKKSGNIEVFSFMLDDYRKIDMEIASDNLFSDSRPYLRMKFLPFFASTLSGEILDFDFTTHPEQDEDEDDLEADGKFLKILNLEFLLKSEGSIFTQNVQFCPPGSFHYSSGSQIKCYRKGNYEFGFGLQIKETNQNLRNCDESIPSGDKLHTLAHLASCNGDMTLIEENSFEFLTQKTINYIKIKATSVIDSPSGLTKSVFLGYSDKPIYFENPNFFQCRNLKDCFECSLMRDCIYQDGECRSIDENPEKNEYIEIWRKHLFEDMGLQSSSALDLGSLKSHHTCNLTRLVKETQDLRILNISNSEEIDFKIFSGYEKTKASLIRKTVTIPRGFSYTEQLSNPEKTPAKYILRISMSRLPLGERSPKSLFPSIILRTQSTEHQLNNPDIEKVYLIDFGKLRRGTISSVKAMFLASNISISFVFPEERHLLGRIRIQVYKSNYTVFMFLAYMVVIVMAFMVIMMFVLVIFSRCATMFYRRRGLRLPRMFRMIADNGNQNRREQALLTYRQMKRRGFIKEKKYRQDIASFEQDKCIVCFVQFKEGDKVAILKCGHIFHVSCVKRWIDQREVKGQYCIVCNAEICQENDEASSTTLELMDIVERDSGQGEREE